MKRTLVILGLLAVLALSLGAAAVLADGENGGEPTCVSKANGSDPNDLKGQPHRRYDKNQSGTSGDDTINGSSGNDNESGHKGDDIIDGNGGNDHINGGSGDDELCGDKGNDHINGDSGDDDISGGPGNDVVNGGKGNDHVGGGAGNDTVIGGPGGDVLRGGSGDDTIMARDGVEDRIYCGKGNDTVTADKVDKVSSDCEHVTRS